MKKRIVIAAVALILLGAACSKIEEGFLSDTLRYKDRVIYAKRGLALTVSDRINADGSTPPISYKFSNLREKASGTPAPKEFETEYEVLVFKAGEIFDPQKDTTVELLNKKRELKKMKPMNFNEISGQLSFNRGSTNLPLGLYTFDLEATNVRGTKVYPAFADINVVDPTTEDVFALTYTAASASNATEQFTTLRAPRVTATKVSDDGARVILKYVDKNGRAFNPAAGQIIKRGDRPFFETHAKFNPIQYTDTAMICDFEVAPFPMQRYITPGTDWGFLLYYRIPKNFVAVDNLSDQAVNPVVEFQLKLEGTYIVQVQLMDVLRAN